MIKLRTLFAGIILSLASTATLAQQTAEKPSFDDYIESVKSDALAQGISEQTLKLAFADVEFIKRSVNLDRNQPEKRQTLDTYLPKRVPQWKIDKARKLYKNNYEQLNQIAEQYGVQARFIVALWGNETNFGTYTGNFDIVSALATLAYDGRREEFFRKELIASLTILDQGHITPEDFKGSWAGAMGQTQFMPSSFLAYAVDQDGDGRKDIWGTQADVFASIANYLKQSGWNDDLTWGRQVKIPADFDESLATLKIKKSLAQWQELGVRRFDMTDLPTRDIQASIVLPDDAQGRAYLAYGNYDVLMKWNRSYYFVTSVGYLSDRIAYPSVFTK
ncbi:lytic murein transglycosylase [Echinimonas agarilytica]|uniref:Lytic murein transglycosylase n=1 Tax=Echinimonas agarilytica TaxID=1215918 RepID=A0AA41W5U0_9GAMM|nr:lytic murein transglycosylase [Echinimonas agarilytica]MCM2679437.1 lytic murein transglycosylase [Echinimonas agarilytica]